MNIKMNSGIKKVAPEASGNLSKSNIPIQHPGQNFNRDGVYNQFFNDETSNVNVKDTKEMKQLYQNYQKDMKAHAKLSVHDEHNIKDGAPYPQYNPYVQMKQNGKDYQYIGQKLEMQNNMAKHRG